MKIGLIGIPKKKLNGEGPAYLIYSKSPLFNYQLKYCEKNFDKVYILAKQGLITPQEQVASNETHPLMLTIRQFKDWQKKIAKQLTSTSPIGAEFILLGSARYLRIFRHIPDQFVFSQFLSKTIIGKQEQFFMNYFAENK